MSAVTDGEPLWHVTVALAGRPVPYGSLLTTLSQLCGRDPANMSVRYRSDLVELRYWDEGSAAVAVAESGNRLWAEARQDLALPDWSVVALEVHDTETWRRRRSTIAPADPPGAVIPLP